MGGSRGIYHKRRNFRGEKTFAIFADFVKTAKVFPTNGLDSILLVQDLILLALTTLTNREGFPYIRCKVIKSRKFYPTKLLSFTVSLYIINF